MFVQVAPGVDLSLRHRVDAGVGPRLGVCSLPSVFVSPAGPLIAEVQFGSLTVTPGQVTLPVLVTMNVYGPPRPPP